MFICIGMCNRVDVVDLPWSRPVVNVIVSSYQTCEIDFPDTAYGVYHPEFFALVLQDLWCLLEVFLDVYLFMFLFRP